MEGTKSCSRLSDMAQMSAFQCTLRVFFYTQPNKGSRITTVNSVSGRAPRQSGTQKRTYNLKWVRGGRFKVKISRLKPTCI